MECLLGCNTFIQMINLGSLTLWSLVREMTKNCWISVPDMSDKAVLVAVHCKIILLKQENKNGKEGFNWQKKSKVFFIFTSFMGK